MTSSITKTFTLPQLRKEFEKQVFAIPALQREFVWNKRKAFTLIDSIYNHYPIGSAMIWESDKSYQLRQHQQALPPYDPNRNKTVSFIIDGQQRLSVLYNILNGNEMANASGEKIDFKKIYFNSSKDPEASFTYQQRTDNKDLVSVTEILNKPLTFFKRHYNQRQYKAIIDCKQRLTTYKFHIVIFKSKDLNAVRETFIRINSLGMTVSAADRAFARATNVDLRTKLSDAKARFHHGFRNIPEENLLTVFSLLDGIQDLGNKGIDKYIQKVEAGTISEKEFDRQWKMVDKCVGKAIDHLRHFLGVYDYSLLPSNNLVTVLACFYAFNNTRNATTAQRQQIKRWFWNTALAARYSGASYQKNILNDVSFFQTLAKRPNHRFAIEDKIELYQLRHLDYRRKSTIVDAYFILLALNRPKYLDIGEVIPVVGNSAKSNRTDRHHIFPRNLLANRGFQSKQYNSILNICYITAEENQSIGGSEPPCDYLMRYKKKRFFSTVMKSHLIPSQAGSGIWNTDLRQGFKKFTEERLTTICRAFEEAAGTTRELFNYK